jgi:hypothetical protein
VQRRSAGLGPGERPDVPGVRPGPREHSPAVSLGPHKQHGRRERCDECPQLRARDRPRLAGLGAHMQPDYVHGLDSAEQPGWRTERLGAFRRWDAR